MKLKLVLFFLSIVHMTLFIIIPQFDAYGFCFLLCSMSLYIIEIVIVIAHVYFLLSTYSFTEG